LVVNVLRLLASLARSVINAGFARLTFLRVKT
jgi:hypothetical protein